MTRIMDPETVSQIEIIAGRVMRETLPVLLPSISKGPRGEVGPPGPRGTDGADGKDSATFYAMSTSPALDTLDKFAKHLSTMDRTEVKHASLMVFGAEMPLEEIQWLLHTIRYAADGS